MASDGTRERLALRDHFLTHLRLLAAERPRRPNLVDTRFGPELEWMGWEREQMAAEVNKQRAERGLPPIPSHKVDYAEQWASGHIDYAEKFALNCAELVLCGESRR